MSKKEKVEEVVEKLVVPILEDNDFELVDIEFVKEGSNWFLRVFIDKEGGITIDDCELVSRALDEKLDEVDPIKNPYILEVSSPGIDRPLKKEADFDRYKGKMIDVKLYKPIDKQKEFTGKLIGLEDNVVKIELDNGQEMNFPRNEIAIARLTVIF